MSDDPLKVHDLIYNPEFKWPEDTPKAATLAYSIFITECVFKARYWTEFGSDLVNNALPKEPFVRQNDAAQKDHAYRKILTTLTPEQRAKVLELLTDCVRGAVFSTLCVLDQFPHGEASVSIADGIDGSGSRTFPITRNGMEFHDEFMKAWLAVEQSAKLKNRAEHSAGDIKGDTTTLENLDVLAKLKQTEE